VTHLVFVEAPQLCPDVGVELLVELLQGDLLAPGEGQLFGPDLPEADFINPFGPPFTYKTYTRSLVSL
jgi:hypothetical protein